LVSPADAEPLLNPVKNVIKRTTDMEQSGFKSSENPPGKGDD
jgi:hypothetical protein